MDVLDRRLFTAEAQSYHVLGEQHDRVADENGSRNPSE
jgi:hypothetical protein